MKLPKILELIQGSSPEDIGAWLKELEPQISKTKNPLDIVSMYQVLRNVREKYTSQQSVWSQVLRSEKKLLDRIAYLVHENPNKEGLKKLFRSKIGMEVSYVFD